jgi:hypothetical protein
MANQMIALQARNPQLPDPAQRTARMANMMNMARQAEAAQLQGERLRQEMEYARAAEGRAVETQSSAQKKAELEYVGLVADQFSRDVGKLKEGDIAGAEALRADIVAKIPTWANYIRPASEWTQDYRVQLMLKGKEIADKTIPDVVASKEYAAAGARDAQGNPIPEGTVIDTRIGGFEGAAGSTPLKERSAATTAPRATPTAPQAAEPANPFAPGYEPNSAAANPNSLGLVIDSALETGVMSKSDYDKLLSIAPPESRAKIAAWTQQNNIQVTPNTPGVTDNQMRGAPADFEVSPMSYDGQTPESQFAVYRGEPMQLQTAGLRGAPPMEQTMAQYIPVQRRDPNVSPLPGSSQVPLPRVAAEARAARETPAEAAAKAAATARATATVETEKKAAEKLPGRKQVSTLVKKVRNAYEALEKQNAIVSEKRGGFANAMDYFATSSLGREAQKMVGTSASKYLSEIVNSRKLLATAIKNATGMSAQEMNSNTELQLMLDALTDPTQGIEAARITLDTLEELYGVPAPETAAAAPRAAAKTPVIPEAAKQMLRKDPSPRQRAFFDRAFGKGAAAKVLGNR